MKINLNDYNNNCEIESSIFENLKYINVCSNSKNISEIRKLINLDIIARKLANNILKYWKLTRFYFK